MKNQNKSNEPKYYVITGIHNGVRKFYNVTDFNFYDKLINGSVAVSDGGAKEIIQDRKIPGGVVEVITESELYTAQADLLTKIALTSAALEIHLNNLSSTLGSKSRQAKQLKLNLGKIKTMLIPMLADYKHFLKQNEDSVDDVAGLYDQVIHNISEISFYDLNEISLVFEAFKRDPKSIIGIAKKIVK